VPCGAGAPRGAWGRRKVTGFWGCPASSRSVSGGWSG
jgi:hypothetical protein